MPTFNRTTITAALPYANGPVHIGHLAGVYLPADIYMRFLRLKGEEAIYVCGSDEHGVPITIRAQKEGITPQQVVDKYDAIIKQSFADFGIEFTHYSRTSKPVHHSTSQEFFLHLHAKGLLEVQESEQYYDEAAQQFLADRYIVGTCPVCQNPDAYGDQCERCGSTLSPNELGNPRSALSGAAPIRKLTSHWYLPLDKYEGWLKEWILEGHKADWKASVYGQCKSWIDQGLQPRAVTRDLDWGVPVPLPEGKGKVLYVWFDAPIGYISATKDWAEATGQAPDAWEKWWKADDTRLLHFIGKDNIVFHCIIFPTMLHAHGGFIVPDNVPGNEFLNLEGQKISTSRNWAVWLHEYLIDFPCKQDVLRYALCSTMPEQKDNDFTWKDFQQRNNSELVGILGNFINRTLVLTQKYYNGALPAFEGKATEVDMALAKTLMAAPERIATKLDAFRFREALAEVMDLARAGNKYLADQEPWKLVKTDAARTAQVLHMALQLSAGLAVLMEPFLPFTSERLRQMLNLATGQTWWGGGAIDLLRPGHQIGDVGLLFDKIEDEAIEAQMAKLAANKVENAMVATAANPNPTELPKSTHTDAETPLTAMPLPHIGIEDFAKVELKVATIIAAIPVPKADKLLQLTLDTGEAQPRTVLSGIAQHYAPEAIIGQQVVLVANLAPRKMRGIESQGMILMAEDAEGKLVFVAPSMAVGAGAGVR